MEIDNAIFQDLESLGKKVLQNGALDLCLGKF